MLKSIQVKIALLACLLPAAVLAQGYPDRPLHMIVPYSVGTPPDIVGRIAATRMQAALGQPILVENRPGASGTIGLAELARQPADGYTLLAIALPTAVAPALYPQGGFDLARDCRAIGQMVFSYNVLVANPALPVASVAELVALLRANPGRYSYGSGGNGTPAHLSGVLFGQLSAASAQHVPYNQLPQAVGDLVAGRLQLMFLASAQALPQIAAGRLRALAVTGTHRLDALNHVPTMVEAGYPDFVVRDWQGLAARAGTPHEIVERLNAELNRGLASAEVRAQLEKMGAEPATGTPRAFDELLAAEVKRWQRVVQSAGIKPD